MTEDELFIFSILPLTKHNQNVVELVEEMCYLTNELNLNEREKYTLKLCQYILVNLYIDDTDLAKELLNVIRMQSTLLSDFERELMGEVGIERDEAVLARDEAIANLNVAIANRDAAIAARDKANSTLDEIKDLVSNAVVHSDEEKQFFDKILSIVVDSK